MGLFCPILWSAERGLRRGYALRASLLCLVLRHDEDVVALPYLAALEYFAFSLVRA